MASSTPAAADGLHFGDRSITFTHNVYYSNKGLITATEVAEALLALDRIVQRTPRVLQAMTGSGRLPKIAVYVERLTEGSLDEDIKIHLLFGSKEQMKRTLKKWKKVLGIDLNTTPGMIRTLIYILLVVGGTYAVTKYAASDKPATHVEIKDNIVINLGSDFKMTGPELVALVDKVVTKKTPLANDAIKVIAPAKKEPEAIVRLDKDVIFTIPRAFIDALPDELPAEENVTTRTIPHAEIRLRAADLDSSEKGWAAVVAGVSERRLRLEFAPSINPDDLYGKRVIHGTVEVISKRDSGGRMTVRSYRVVEIDPE